MNKKRVFTVLVSGLICMSQTALAEKRVLNTDEIMEMFSGKTVWGNHTTRDKKNMVYYSPDGTFEGKRLIEGSTSKKNTVAVIHGDRYNIKHVNPDKIHQGKWSVDKKGRLCIKKKKKQKMCRVIAYDNGVIKGFKGSNEHIWTGTKFEDGNHIQLSLAEQRVLNADEIMATFSGKTAWGHHAFKPKNNMVYYSPDGKFKGKRLDKNKAVQGEWSVDKKDRLCIHKDGDVWCRKIFDDDGVIKKYKKSKHVWTFTKFEDGNKL